MEVDAFASMLAIPTSPNVGHWQAVEKASDYECCAICKAYRQENVYSPPKFFAREDAQTKAEERHLCKCNGQKVKYFSKPCELQVISG